MFAIQGTEPDPRSRDEARLALEDEIAEAQAAVNASQARLIDLISEHLEHEYWGDHAWDPLRDRVPHLEAGADPV